MENQVETEVYLLEQSVLAVLDQSKVVASVTDEEAELVEELRQIAVALHYATQTLRLRLALPNMRARNIMPLDFPDLRMASDPNSLPDPAIRISLS